MKYTWLDYKIALSLLKQAQDELEVTLQFQTIEGPGAIEQNAFNVIDIRKNNKDHEVTLIHAQIEFNGNWILIQIFETRCFVMYTKKDHDPEVEDDFTDYREAIRKFYDTLEQSLKQAA